MTKAQRRGRTYLLIIIAFTFVVSLTLLALQSATGRLKLSSVIRTVVEGARFYQLWQGARWARRLMTFLCASGGVACVVYAILIGFPGAIPLGVMGVIYGTFGILLFASQDVDAFLRLQSTK